MSRASKITFGVTCLFTLTSIIGVHYIQEMERQTLHQGPIKDAKRMADKRQKEKEKETSSIGETNPNENAAHIDVMKSPNDSLSPEAKEKKKNFNRADHEMQQQLRQKYEQMQPLSGEVVTKDGEVVQDSGTNK